MFFFPIEQAPVTLLRDLRYTALNTCIPSTDYKENFFFFFFYAIKATRENLFSFLIKKEKKGAALLLVDVIENVFPRGNKRKEK